MKCFLRADQDRQEVKADSIRGARGGFGSF